MLPEHPDEYELKASKDGVYYCLKKDKQSLLQRMEEKSKELVRPEEHPDPTLSKSSDMCVDKNSDQKLLKFKDSSNKNQHFALKSRLTTTADAITNGTAEFDLTHNVVSQVPESVSDSSRSHLMDTLKGQETLISKRLTVQAEENLFPVTPKKHEPGRPHSGASNDYRFIPVE